MTRDERFSAEHNGFQDHKTGRRLTEWFEIVRVLNELADENKQLKSEIRKQSKQCTASIQRFKEENEQLKTFLESMKEELSLANRDNTTLEKENEQLKKAMKELKDMLQFDVDNGIESYPKILSEYLIEVLTKIGDMK